MIATEIQILIPCHSLEDFPTDQPDLNAASLLNSFAVAFHPALINWTRECPQWRRADNPPLPRAGQLVFIPTACDDWLPHGWVDEARQAGSTVVCGLSDRHEMIAAALEVVRNDHNLIDSGGNPADDSPQNIGDAPVEDERFPFEVDPDLVGDFLALGTNWLLVELLTRRMRQFGNIEESRFFQRLSSAANAAVADDRETARTHLLACFEMLLEARERFYPVECYLLDLCLVSADVNQERLRVEVGQTVPISLLTTSDDLNSLCQLMPAFSSELSNACEDGRACIVGGEDRETSIHILPLESVIFHLESGVNELQRLTGKPITIWGRRRFGLTALVPQILVKFGYKAALHVALDDGIYPDSEHTKLRWRGVDGTVIDALSRIPLAADSAISYLRFPSRMSESMDHDQVAGLILARWPDVSGPWFDDLRRSQKYAPCLGRFVTLEHFFDQTELPGQLSTHKPGEYFSPVLIQHVARKEEQPISRYAGHADRRRKLDSSVWFRSTASVLMGKAVPFAELRVLEEAVEACAPPMKKNKSGDGFSTSLADLEASSTADLSQIIMHSAPPGRGFLVLNPLSFARRVVVDLPPNSPVPAIGGVVKAVDIEPTRPGKISCVVEVPGCGYAWFPIGTSDVMPITPKLPLAENGLLRNDLFEVAINQRTGGIAHIRFHNQRSKRMSQQLSFRFPRERSIAVGPESADKVNTRYADMRCLGIEVVRSGTACGEIATWGEIVDQTTEEKIASFRQTIRVWRGMSTVEINVTLSDVKMPDGDPWNNYFTSRFAWNDSAAAVTRSIYHSAHSFVGERFETSDYLEMASEDERLTIIPHGLPFHRKTGERMVDSLLIVAGETERQFQFTVAVDAPYPLEEAWNAISPAPVVMTDRGQPGSGPTGWFFHVDARHIQITRILESRNVAGMTVPSESGEHTDIYNAPGFAVRLIETEGRSRRAKLRCFRQPKYARKRDFRGETISELIIEGDAVLVDISGYEVADVELRFGG